METNGLTGVVEGHFHAPRLDLPPQGVLSVNMRDATNVNRFNARFDMLRPSTAQATNLDVESRENQQAQVGSSRLTALGQETVLTAQRQRHVLPSQTGLTRTGELQAYAQAVADRIRSRHHGGRRAQHSGLRRPDPRQRPILVRGAGHDSAGPTTWSGYITS